MARYKLQKDYINSAGRVITEGTIIEIHSSDIDKFTKLGCIGILKIQESENAIAKQPKKETRKK
jgi:hypothetical protein